MSARITFAPRAQADVPSNCGGGLGSSVTQDVRPHEKRHALSERGAGDVRRNDAAWLLFW